MTKDRLHGCQVRAARAMLMWSVRQLAQQSGVSESSIRRIEAEFGVPKNITLDLLVRLQKFFEERGFRFTWLNGVPGVFWDRKRVHDGLDFPRWPWLG